MAEVVGQFGRVRIDSRTAALAGALLLHLVLLAPVIWGLVGRPSDVSFDLDADPLIIPLDMQAPGWPGARRRQAAPQSPMATAPSRPLPRLPRPATSAEEAAASPSVSTPIVPGTAAQSQAQIDEAWRVGGDRPGRASWGGDVCRDLSNLRAWEAANCRERGPTLRAEARGSPPAEVARPEPRRGRPPGEAREEGFAEQAAANEAWRSYTRERDAPYPGLRSLLKHH